LISAKKQSSTAASAATLSSFQSLSVRTTEDVVGFFRKNRSNDQIPIDPDNISNKDWVISLEAGTITGTVARPTAI
jgi:hypothetical protein